MKKDIKYSLLSFLLAFLIPIFTFIFISFRGLYFEANNLQFIIFHTTAELFSSVVGISIFIISAFAYRKSGNRRLIIFGAAFLFMAIIDYFHAISFPDVRKSWNVIEEQANVMLWFWVLSKLIGSGLIFLSAFLPKKYVREEHAIKNSILLMTFNCMVLFFFLLFYTIEKNIQLFSNIFGKDVSIPSLFAILDIVIITSFFISYYWVRYLDKGFIENEESRNIFSLSIITIVLIFSLITFYIITNYQHKISKLIDKEELTQLNMVLTITTIILITLTTTRYLIGYIERRNIVLFMLTIGFIFFIFSIISTLVGRISDLYITIQHIFNIFFNVAILFALLIVIKKD